MSSEELLAIKGGVSKGIILGAVGVLITFMIGLVDGYVRPLTCNK